MAGSPAETTGESLLATGGNCLLGPDCPLSSAADVSHKPLTNSESHCHPDGRLCLQAVLQQVRSPWASKIMAAEEFLERQTMLLLQIPATPLHVELLQHVLQQFVQSAGTLQGGLPAPCFHSHLTSNCWLAQRHACFAFSSLIPDCHFQCLPQCHAQPWLAVLITVAAWLPQKAHSLPTAAADLPTVELHANLCRRLPASLSARGPPPACSSSAPES